MWWLSVGLTAFGGSSIDRASFDQCWVRGRNISRRKIDLSNIDWRRRRGSGSIELGSHEGSGRLHCIDMLVQVTRQRPLRSAGKLSTIFMGVDWVFSRKQVLRVLYTDSDVDPVLRRAVVEVVHAIGHQPFVNKVQCLVLRLDKSIYFLVAEMLAIADVVWVGY
jgi:hypothetical protein